MSQDDEQPSFVKASASAEAPDETPLELKIVGWIFLGTGSLGSLHAGLELMDGSTKLIGFFMIVFIFIGRGLLKGQESHRIWALISLWIGMFVMVFIGALITVFPIADMEIGDLALENVPKPLALLVTILVIALQYWQVRVLNKPSIRALFRFHCLDDEEDPTAAQDDKSASTESGESSEENA